MIFDVASRVVLGFHATLEAPSATSVPIDQSFAAGDAGVYEDALENQVMLSRERVTTAASSGRDLCMEVVSQSTISVSSVNPHLTMRA